MKWIQCQIFFPTLFESGVPRLWERRWSSWTGELKSLQEAMFSDQKADWRTVPQHATTTEIAAQVSGWCQGLAFLELVAVLLVLCVRNQRPPLLEWEADVSEEFSWLQQFFSCPSFDCCLSPSLSPLLPFYFSLFAVHTIRIVIFPLFFPTLTHTKPELRLNLRNNPPEKALPASKSQIWSLPHPFLKEAKEGKNEKESAAVVTEVLFLNHSMGFERHAWLWGLPRWQDPCLTQEAAYLAALCTSCFSWNSTIAVETPGRQRWFHPAAARTLSLLTVLAVRCTKESYFRESDIPSAATAHIEDTTNAPFHLSKMRQKYVRWITNLPCYYLSWPQWLWVCEFLHLGHI